MNSRTLLDAIAIPRARAAHYALPVPADARCRLSAAWMLLALASLAVSGVFSVLLVLSRTPGIKDVFPLVDFFHVALVVHVDLSVLVWFLAFAGVLWSLNAPRARLRSGGRRWRSPVPARQSSRSRPSSARGVR